jgi:hypothetical protein
MIGSSKIHYASETANESVIARANLHQQIQFGFALRPTIIHDKNVA